MFRVTRTGDLIYIKLDLINSDKSHRIEPFIQFMVYLAKLEGTEIKAEARDSYGALIFQVESKGAQSSPIDNQQPRRQPMTLPANNTMTVGSVVGGLGQQQGIIVSSPITLLFRQKTMGLTQHAKILMNGVGIGSVTAQGPPHGAILAKFIDPKSQLS